MHLKKMIVLTIGALMLWMGAAQSQDYTGRAVAAVEFKGLERVSEQVVRAKLEVQPGQPYNQNAIARDIRRLYETGYFSNIKADATPKGEQVSLAYQVEEKRVVQEVRVVGTKKVKARKLLGALTIHEGDSFIADALDAERGAIIKYYEGKGFANTVVDAVVEQTGSSRVRLTYFVEEGKKARIHSIRFDGNDTMSDRELRKMMKTKRAWWFLGGKYDETKLETDFNKVVDGYGNVGHLEAQIPKTDLEYTKSGKGMDITVFVNEGPQYEVGTLDLAGNKVFDDDELMEEIKVQAGDVHNKGQVAKDAESIQKGYRDSGYVQAVTEPRVTLDRANKKTNVVYDVSEADMKYIREILATGNDTTKDEIIRREMLIKPGERYDGTAVEASKRRLDNTRYFEAVRINAEDFEGDPLFTKLKVNVEEGKTGMFNFGAGFSTEDGMSGFTELKLDNFDILNWPKFSGGGQQFRIKLNAGDRRDEYSLSWTDPEFAGYPLAVGFDLFDESYRVRGGARYTEAQSGGQIRIGKSLSPFVTWRQSFRYQITDLSDLPFGANYDLSRQRGESTTVSTMTQLERNTIDRYSDPGKGYRTLFSAELAGLGGDHEFLKLEGDSAFYIPLNDKKSWVLGLRSRPGWMTEYGSSDYIPLQDRFYVGGSHTVRGYDNRDIGPKVREYWYGKKDFAIGGNIRMLNNVELKYVASELLRVFTFFDSGGVWQSISDVDFGEIKYSVGVGMGFDIPRMGPIRVDYGFPLNPEKDQGSGRLHLTTGFRF